ncbi:MAG: hypothetical protein OER96_09240 [Gammaproteobacteria bacterium]|nr:hypothetical protein [Gammaproteobacteria bacterium]
MKSILIIVVIVAAVLYFVNQQYGASSDPEKINPQALPQQVEQEVNEALQQSVDRLKKADEAID